ncbi:hypothetical protein [Undibacterium sp. WLHG33]
MDFSDRQQEPGKKFLGIGLVIAFHVVLVYALLNGLGTIGRWQPGLIN